MPYQMWKIFLMIYVIDTIVLLTCVKRYCNILLSPRTQSPLKPIFIVFLPNFITQKIR